MKIQLITAVAALWSCREKRPVWSFPDVPNEVDGLSPADMARMEREMGSLSVDFRQINKKHGKNVLNLVISVAYLKKTARQCPLTHPDIFAEFQKVVESKTINVDDQTPTA